jgi:hypothetical protein
MQIGVRIVHEMVMTLSLSPSWVVTSTTGPGSIKVKARLNFNGRMRASPDFQSSNWADIGCAMIQSRALRDCVCTRIRDDRAAKHRRRNNYMRQNLLAGTDA